MNQAQASAPPQRDGSGIRTPAELRYLRAILAWRMRRILSALPHRERRAIRLLPALLHASYPTLDLRGEAPGIEGLSSARRSWLALGRIFGLPAPTGTQRHRKTIRAILALPDRAGIELLVVPVPGIRQPEVKLLLDRCKTAQGILQRQGATIAIRLIPPMHEDPDQALRLLLFGGLLAGGLPNVEWDSLTTPDSRSIARLVETAPSRLTAAFLLFLRPGSSATAIRTLFRARSRGHGAGLLADPELFCAAWVSRERPEGKLPLEVMRVASAAPLSRLAASTWLGGASPSAPPTGPLSLAALGRRFIVAAARAIRRHPLAESMPLRRFFRSEILTPGGIPACLSEALQNSLRTRSTMRPAELIALGGGGTASHLETRLIRGLALAGADAGRLGHELDPPWQRLAMRMERRDTRRIFLLAFGVADYQGPPLDPLNRGPGRTNTLRNPLAATIPARARPTARTLLPHDALASLLRAAIQGEEIEILADSPAAAPAASRLVRLAERVAANHGRGGPPFATEIGGTVLIPSEAGSRRFGLRAFSRKPRCFTPDLDAPDLGAVGGWAGLPPRGTVDCAVVDQGDGTASLHTTDAQGFRIREEVDLERLETHLAEARSLLRVAPRPAILTVRIGGSGGMIHAPPLEAEPVAIGVQGDLLHGLRIVLLGERFGRGERLGWEAAAATLLSAWPPTSAPALRIQGFEVSLRGEPVSGIELLYARSVVLRRIEVHVRRLARIRRRR